MVVETKIVLAMLSTTFLGEYIEPTKYVRIALGIELWIKITPASTPVKLKNLIIIKPIIGPITILVKEFIRDNLNEKTLSFVRAIPKAIKTINIVA